jgi:hypothetical protein
MPAAIPPASVKLPNSGWPAKVAVVKAMIAPPPMMTSAMPIHRSSRSYLMKRGVMRLSMT